MLTGLTDDVKTTEGGYKSIGCKDSRSNLLGEEAVKRISNLLEMTQMATCSDRCESFTQQKRMEREA